MEENNSTKKIELNNESLERFEEIVGMNLNEIEELRVSRIL